MTYYLWYLLLQFLEHSSIGELCPIYHCVQLKNKACNLFDFSAAYHDHCLQCVICWSFLKVSVANSVDPNQTAPLGVG